MGPRAVPLAAITLYARVIGVNPIQTSALDLKAEGTLWEADLAFRNPTFRFRFSYNILYVFINCRLLVGGFNHLEKY